MGEMVVMSCSEEVAERESRRKRQRTEKQDGSPAVVQREGSPAEMVLRVLLVEADDSTRQIIAALLLKCSYKVTAVPDGLKAWEILKGKPHNIDLVLTEVELPSISGFALLTLVMEHDVCKNIPVIMMSLHDSISMVLKCMLKGAADFLIKPVRKNELRNLWQHVWRRHTLTGAYIPQNSTVTQKKVEDGNEKNTASSHSSDHVISSEKDVKGSDAQSSCTTPFLEAENAYVQSIQSLPLSKSKSDFDIEKQKCAKLSNETVLPESENKEKSIGSKFTVSFNENYSSIALRLEEDYVCAEAMTHYESVGSESAGSGNIISEINGHNNEVDEPSSGVIDFIGTFDNHPLSSHVHSCCINSHMTKFECLPQLELSLRRFCPSSLKNDVADERHTLNHSNASAFSCCTEMKEGTDEILDLLSNHHSENVAAVFPQRDATLGNNQENSTSLLNGQSGLEEISFSRPQLGIAGYGHLFPSVFHTKSDIGSAWSPISSCQQEQSPLVQTNTATNNNVKKGYNWSDETCDDQIVNEKNSLEGMEILRRDFPAAGQSCSSGLCNGVVNQLNSSSGYGSNISCTSDGATATAPLADRANARESSHDHGLISQQDGLRGLGSNSHRTSQREAALTKFRLKRKDRCFEKKVRYQSRKRLAEQRPRVKGQFVRQLQTLVAAADGCPQES